MRNVILITQARSGSTRLPGKVLLKVHGQELLKIHLDRIRKAKLVNEFVLATTTNTEDDVIQELCEKWGVRFSRGSEQDVLDRYYQAAKPYKPDYVVRVTSDCPLVDPEMIDAVVAFTLINDIDYGANILSEKFPDGQDVEVFKFSALEKAWNEAKLQSEREHVTPFIKKNSDYNAGNLFTAMDLPSKINYTGVRMTVDVPQDLELIRVLVEKLGTGESWFTYANYIIEKNLHNLNSGVVRNEGYLKSLRDDKK